MNILIISKLSGNLWAGPNNSIPEQVRSLSKIDNCLWYNLNSVKRDEWTIDGLDCKNFDDYPSGRLLDLPAPFNRPDFAIVQEVYCYPFERILSDLIKEKIPYIIVPRSTLTEQAQANKRIKKIIGNIIWFNHMVNHAVAIQYLTEEEKKESEDRWHVKSKVIPNGIDLLDIKRHYWDGKNIEAIYIGRVDVYQKGFDILLEAITKAKKELRDNAFHLSVFGPDRENAYSIINQIIKENGIEDIITLNPPVFKDEKEKILEQADVFVMASRFEGLPMGLLEAFSYGIPCVITRGTNLKDFVDSFEAGWTTENNAMDFSRALKLLCENKERINAKGEKAFELAKEFSWESIAHATHNWMMSL